MTLTIRQLAEQLDRHVMLVEKSVAALQEKGLVSGYVPSSYDAQISLTPAAEAYFN
ncbi:hypothetical protein [Vogesella sp. XCS3]|uniref:hypothetical protein n=1 Tax=Vogesella sp. XCS3 TaxID=2877939 RepID=UPI001D09C686|nr:hypothetical protein [Vogesella sp. XCS3]UDM18927.1 hypothetical protein LCH97_17950 [Vogesella sp. XCS3]